MALVGLERALARVDVGAIERNCARLKSILEKGAELCAVVKADGYGHGAAGAARAALAGGAARLAVATAREAADLREQEVDAPILVMGALTRAETDIALGAGADVVAWTESFVKALGGRGARVHVKLDTGMGRLGIKDPEEAHGLVELVAASEGLELGGVMTHFATADEPDEELFPVQLERFAAFVDRVKQDHPDVVAHAANSAASLRQPTAHFDMVRCGIAIYGLDPFHEDADLRMLEPALSLHSWVASVKRFEPADSAGYGRRWRAAEPTWVGVLPIGYGDGWRRGLSNRCDVLVRGRHYPLVGTISMDNVTVALGPETDVEPGDPAVLIGKQGDERITCEEVARQLNTINYEITCGLSPRVPRTHVR